PDVEGWFAHSLIFALGLFVMAFGVAFYITPNLGAGPRDTLMLVLVEKFNMKLSMARNVMELGAAVAGFLLGGPVFIGTVIIILGLGRLIEVFLPLTRKLMVRFLGGDDPEIMKVILRPRLPYERMEIFMKKYCDFAGNGTSYRREIIGGLTTFLSMAYILAVNPSVLSLQGIEGIPDSMKMDMGAVFVATALAAFIGC